LAFRAFGNAVNVDLVEKVAKNLLSPIQEITTPFFSDPVKDIEERSVAI
jgi:hypothetical protein